MILTWVCLVISTQLDAARLASFMSSFLAKRVQWTPSVEPSILIILIPPTKYRMVREVSLRLIRVGLRLL